tara:strand:+ start:4757 stop:4954 length:198 start_codon:yes stop_codon:yes gene_type:complete
VFAPNLLGTLKGTNMADQPSFKLPRLPEPTDDDRQIQAEDLCDEMMGYLPTPSSDDEDAGTSPED